MGIPLRYNGAIVFTALVMAACSALGQFSHKKPWPTYSLQNMPQTRFTCHDKILGGYYADPETQCQMFHVCVKVAGVGVQDFRFLCPNGTAFDQEAQICADWGDVDCEQSVLYYGSDNFDLYRIGSGFESKRAPLAEEEEEATFHLQRAESGDIRRSKETRVDQKLRPETTDYTKKSEKYESTTRTQFYDANSENRRSNYDQNNDFQRATPRYQETQRKTTSSYYTTPKGNDFHNNAESKQDADDLFKGSHSSNFFSNRNNGREDDSYDHKVTTVTTTTTSTTSRPYNPPNQFLNGNGPQSDYNEFNRIPDASTKRPSRGRRPIPNNNLISNPTTRPSLPSTTFATTVPDVPKSTRRLSVQSSFNAAFNFGNDQHYTPTTTSTTSTSTTQRNTSPVQKFAFGANDYQQNIQPTTYNPSGAFRYKATTSKYDDINETALRGEKPNPSAIPSGQFDNENLEIFSRVSNRKSQNSERNIQKQQAKNVTLANRNEFTDFAKTKAPSGFQTPSHRPQSQTAAPLNLGPSVQPLDPNKLNSELRSISPSQAPSRGRLPSSRFNDRQQNEPQYFRSKTQETPAPFAFPQVQQQQAQKQFDSFLNESVHKDFSRSKAESRAGSTAVEEVVQKPFESTFNAYASPQRDVSRTRPDQRAAVESNQQRDIPKVRSQQRTGSTTNQPQQGFSEFSSPQREFVRHRPEQRPAQQSQQHKPANHFDSSFNGGNNPQRDVLKSELRRGPPSNQDFDQPRLDLTSTTGASISTAAPRGRGRINFKATTQHHGRSLDSFVQSTTSAVKKFSTLVPKDQYYPTTFKPTTYKKAFEQKPTKYTDPKPRGQPYSTTTTALPGTSSQSFNTPDENDGQYHPELYELDYTNVASQTKSPAYQKPKPTQPPHTSQSPQAYLQSQQQTSFQKQAQQQQQPFNNNFQQPKHTTASPTDLSDEEELFKTAHSLNLGAASVNKLRADTLKTIDKTPQQSSPNFGFDRSTHPTPASPTTTWRPTTNFIATTTTVRTPSQSKKPRKSSSSKRPSHADSDTSYDYAYYDSLSESPQEYPEYDVISEFRKTRKH